MADLNNTNEQIQDKADEQISDKTEEQTLDKQEQDKPKKKERKTLFWGVGLDTKKVKEYEPIKKFLEEHEELIPLRSVHTTLLYVGRVDNEDEELYIPFRYKKCVLTIGGYGYSEKAVALKVESIKFDDDSNVPTFAETQHITVALAKDIKAVESVKTLRGEGEMVEFDMVLELEGKIFKC